jgi:hypothetical protein
MPQVVIYLEPQFREYVIWRPCIHSERDTHTALYTLSCSSIVRHHKDQLGPSLPLSDPYIAWLGSVHYPPTTLSARSLFEYRKLESSCKHRSTSLEGYLDERQYDILDSAEQSQGPRDRQFSFGNVNPAVNYPE